jgi:hypothetical protein
MLLDLVFNWMNPDSKPPNPKFRYFLGLFPTSNPTQLQPFISQRPSLPTYFLCHPPSFVPPSFTIELHIISPLTEAHQPLPNNSSSK